MMAKGKRTGAVFITAACLLLCGCQTEAERTEETAQVQNVQTAENTSLTFFSVDGDVGWNDPVAREITKKTGVSLKMQALISEGDYQIPLMIATSNYPDMIFAKGDAQKLIESDALIDMAPLIEEYGPNIKKLYGERYNWLRYSEEDPAIYQLCCAALTESVTETGGTVQLQYAALKENDYQIPRTLEEYEKAIKNYLEKYPETDGEKNIGISIVASDWHWLVTLANPAGFIANGAPDDGQWIVDEDLNVSYKHFNNEEQKEFFRWLNRMYHEGILDPEFATQTYEEYIQKIEQGRVVGLMDAKWDYESAVKNLKSAGKYDKDYAPLPVTISEDVPCTVHIPSLEPIGWGVGITKSCDDPVQAVKFLDFLCSDEGQVLVHWGIEDVNYTVDENGMRQRSAEEIRRKSEDPLYAQDTGVGLHNYPFPTRGDYEKDSTGNPYTTSGSDVKKEEYQPAEKEALEALGVDSFLDIFPEITEERKAKYPPLWAQYIPTELSEKEEELDDISWNGLVACIIAQPEEFDAGWENLMKELEAAGAKEAGEEMTRLLKSRMKFWESFDQEE